MIIEIPRPDWQSFCDQFSRQHDGWQATVSSIATSALDGDPQAKTRPLAVNLPFRGVIFDEHGAEAAVRVGETARELTHSVRHPSRIGFEQIEGGAHQGLRIDAVNGETTLVRFRSPALPEALNGLSADP